MFGVEEAGDANGGGRISKKIGPAFSAGFGIGDEDEVGGVLTCLAARLAEAAEQFFSQKEDEGIDGDEEDEDEAAGAFL